MLPSIPSENSGGLEGTRAARSSERTEQALAHAPQDADAGEAERGRRVDGVELSLRGEHFADARRRADAARGSDRRLAVGARAGSEAEGRTNDETSSEAAREERRADREVERVRQSEGPILGDEEVRELRDLQRADRRTRVGEYVQRQMAAGQVSGAPQFRYQEGPDGRRYAVNAESTFDTPSATDDDPRRAARDAATVRRATLASPNASPSERAEAARASSAEARARAAIARDVTEASEADRRNAAEAYERARERMRPSSSEDGRASSAA